MDEMIYNPDGTIQNRRYWSVEGPDQVGTLNPFQRVEAETIAWSEGVKTHFETEWEGDFDWARGEKIADRLFVTSINHGDYIMVQGVNFEEGAKSVEVSISPVYRDKSKSALMRSMALSLQPLMWSSLVKRAFGRS